jgi:hypothetical protein
MNARQRRLHRRLLKRIWDSKADERKLTKLIEGDFDKPCISWQDSPITDYYDAKVLAKIIKS